MDKLTQVLGALVALILIAARRQWRGAVRTHARLISIGGVPHWLYPGGLTLPAMMGGDGTTAVALAEKREAKLKEARGIIDGAEAAERDLTEEEQKAYDGAMSDAASIKRRLERLSEVEAGEAELRTVPGGGRVTNPDPDENPEAPRVGMTPDDLRKWSLLRLIRALANPSDREAQKAASFEYEISEAVSQRMGKEPQGAFVPFDILSAPLLGPDQIEQRLAALERRDLSVGTATAGGHTVATDLLSESFIDLLRNRMVVRTAGATVLSGLVGNIAIPRQTGAGTAYWVAEAASPTESQQAFDQVAMSPSTVGGFTDYSRKLLLQSSLDVEAFVRGDLTRVLAIEIDRATLHGSGSGAEPQGVQGATSVAVVAIGTNGGPPLWSHIVNLETEVSVDNADFGRLAYISNAKVRGKLKQTDKGTDTGRFVWAEGSTPLNGYPAFVTNQVRSDLTKGTGSNLSAIFFGNWADVLIGMWGALDLLVDPYTGGTSGTVRVVALQDVDIGFRHGESFSTVVDAVTT